MKTSKRHLGRRNARAYTMIEVMMALGLLAVGASGIIVMQKAAIVANATAKQIATGTKLAERWAERLRVDAMVWNSDNPNEMPQTRWLKGVATPNQWILPAAIPLIASPEADPLGADLIAAGDPAAVGFCTHISYRQMSPKMVSAVIRVTWRRDSSPIACAAPEMFVPQTNLTKYGSVYMTVGLVMQERPE